MTVLHILSFAAAIAAFGFVVLSLASGLLWISELIEEHSKAAKLLGKRGIYAIIVLHIALYFLDNLPFWRVLFGIACHLIYLQNFSNAWPAISLSSASFVTSCIAVVADHFLWFFYFSKLTQEARSRSYRVYGRPSDHQAPGFGDVATFFTICVWITPLFLFLSLSANDSALPSMNIHGDAEPFTPVETRPRGSLFKSILRFKRRDSLEGLIAPRSPNLVAITPRLSVPTLNDMPSRPTSPLQRPPPSPRTSNEFKRPEGMIPPRINPVRSATLGAQTMGGQGMGMRRVSSFTHLELPD